MKKTQLSSVSPSIRGGFLFVILITGILAAISSCSSLGLAPAKTFNDKVAMAQTSFGIANELAFSALNSGVITLNRATTIRDELAKIKVDLSVIESLETAGQGDTALMKLAGINSILLKLRAEMGEGK